MAWLQVMSRTLRAVAHAHGAFLTYLGGLRSASGDGGSAEERQLLDAFCKLMNQLVFTGLDKRPTLKLGPQTDHMGPIMVPAGADTFSDIGRPGRGGGAAPGGPVADEAAAAAVVAEWAEALGRIFPPRAERAAKGRVEVDARYKEEEVDAACARCVYCLLLPCLCTALYCLVLPCLA